MAGYIGKSQGVTQVDGHTKSEADAEYVNDPNEVITVSGGNVGIGTSSPAYKLDVNSDSMRVSTGSHGYALTQYGQHSTPSNNWHVGSEGDGTFRFYNGNLGGGTERMRIDSAGRVTMPYQPSAVCYFGDANTYVQESLNWVFDNTEYNNGNHYSNSTGRFTCPVAGVYQVSIFTISSSNTDAYYLVVRKNGVEQGRAYQYTRVGQMHLQVKCNAGDYLQVGSDSTTLSIYHGRHFTKASFHLLG